MQVILGTLTLDPHPITVSCHLAN